MQFIVEKFGIDGAIGYTLISRIIYAMGGIVTLFFIALFLSKEEQGYYYTFGSILAIQIFFELGLNSVITQYTAHEMAHLKWKTKSELSGEILHLSRLSSLLRFCIKLFTIIAFFLFIILELCGYLFFNKFNHDTSSISWQFPWMMVALTTSLMFIISPILSFIEGLGKVKEIARLRLFQQTSNVLTIGLVLLLGGKLYALGFASLITFVILIFSILFTDRKNILLFIYKAKNRWKINYWKEIFPYQWKIALSWISGYFIFQLFNPVLFATDGPIVAGQMGMTIVALNGISSLSMSWISTKVPKFSSLIALKDYKTLDKIFFITLRQLALVNLLLLFIFAFIIYLSSLMDITLSKRFVPFFPLILLCGVNYINQYIFSWATYLRCHKQEPFLVNSIAGAILCTLSTVILGKSFGLTGIVLGYFIITCFIGLPWGYLTFKINRLKWHL